MTSSVSASEPPPLVNYGQLPTYSMLTLSPSGKLIALRESSARKDRVTVIELESMTPLTSIDVSETNPRRLRFVNDDTLLMIAGQTARRWFRRSAFDFSAAFSVNTRTGKGRQLMLRAKGVYEGQSGLGRILGVSDDGTSVFMPAYENADNAGGTRYSLFEVHLDRALETRSRRGLRETIDWFVDSGGNVVVQEDYDNDRDLHTIWAVDGSERRQIYQRQTAMRHLSTIGLSQDRASLVVGATADSPDLRGLYQMSLDDGSLAGPIFDSETKGVARVFLDANRVLQGVAYSGFKPTYRFFDEELTAKIANIQAMSPDTAMELRSWSADFSKLVFRMSGGWHSGAYLLVTNDSPKPRVLAIEREGIPSPAVAPTEITEYEARDGLEIPALVTAYKDVRASGNAPLVVLPHGGPESHDDYDFHWLAQFFASRGYVVLQPQFRGSTGFGIRHREAGYGEWGRKMQYDLDDGVAHLVDSGLVDRDRVCIVGASYGGYAAMAAVAFSEGIYKCAVAINGVFDLGEMIEDERRDFGRGHWVLSYWEKQHGADGYDRKALDAISPALHAKDIDVPVLVIHGRDDTVVPVDQGRLMRSALRSAKADFDYVELKAEDHWLSDPDSRIETLKAIGKFVDAQLHEDDY